MRVYDPWPELEEFANSWDLSKLDSKIHNHLPYAILLIKAVKKWKAENNGVMPKNFGEKMKFQKECIPSLQHHQGGLNFDEAKNSASEGYKTNALEFEL